MICEFCGDIYDAGEDPGVCIYSRKFRCDKPECIEASKAFWAEREANRPEAAVKEIREALKRIEEKLDKVLSRGKGCPRCGHGVALMVGDDPAGVARCPKCNHRWYYPSDMVPT